MPNPKRPDLSAIPRLTEPLENDELTAHFAVPRELLEQLREHDDATRIQRMPAGFLDDERTREIRADPVHTAPTLPPPSPPAAQAALPRPAAAPARVAFPPTSDAELRDQVSAMRRPQRVARAVFVVTLSVVAGVVLLWRLLSP